MTPTPAEPTLDAPWLTPHPWQSDGNATCVVCGHGPGRTIHDVAPDPAPLDVERLAVVAAARALRERLTIDPGNVVSWGEWDTLDEALAAIEGSKE